MLYSIKFCQDLLEAFRLQQSKKFLLRLRRSRFGGSSQLPESLIDILFGRMNGAIVKTR